MFLIQSSLNGLDSVLISRHKKVKKAESIEFSLVAPVFCILQILSFLHAKYDFDA